MTARRKLYLAGKIRDRCWRNTIVDGHILDDGYGYDSRFDAAWPTHLGAVFASRAGAQDGLADYVGPYFTCIGHGMSHGRNRHGNGEWGYESLTAVSQAAVRARCKQAIYEADGVFAYLETTDCYGTLHELGYAEAFKKSISICIDPAIAGSLDDLWFMQGAAVQVVVSDRPDEVLRAQLTPRPVVQLDSEAERRFWTAHEELRQDALIGLVTQHPVLNYRLDFALPAARIAIEIDGHAYHSSPDQFHNDRVRQRRLEMEGWRFIRFSGREACREPEHCVYEAAKLVAKWRAEV